MTSSIMLVEVLPSKVGRVPVSTELFNKKTVDINLEIGNNNNNSLTCFVSVNEFQ